MLRPFGGFSLDFTSKSGIIARTCINSNRRRHCHMSYRSSTQTGLITRALVIALPLFLAACSSVEQRAQAHYKSGNELLLKED